MKKCPKCKAEIQEEARFCLYCMTSFEEKQTIETPNENNKRWLIIIAAVLVLVLIIVGIFLLAQKDRPNNEGTDNSTSSSVSSNLDTSDDNTTSSEQQNSESQGNETSTPISSNQTQTPSKNEGNTTNNSFGNTTTTNSSTSGNSQNSNTNNTTTNNSTTSSNSENSNTNNTTNSSSNSTSTNSTSSSNKTESSNTSSSTSTTTTPSQTTTVTYMYRDAKYGDDFSVSANLENAVVITGVKTTAADGKYIIPETLDGKKVVAIMALAFCDDNISSTVKTVIVPSSVKTIWNNAFANCYNLSDIYFKGNSIYTESNAFPEKPKRNGTLIIHCSANCSDRNYRYYKNSASYYDAEYEEWNG